MTSFERWSDYFRHWERLEQDLKKNQELIQEIIEDEILSACCLAEIELIKVSKDHIGDTGIKEFSVCSNCGQEVENDYIELKGGIAKK